MRRPTIAALVLAALPHALAFSCCAHGHTIATRGTAIVTPSVSRLRMAVDDGDDQAAPRGEAVPSGRAPPRPFGRALVLTFSYGTISAVWYVVGMQLLVSAMPPIRVVAGGSLRRAVVVRLWQAWVACFAASQVTAPWRAAGAVAITPLLSRALLRGRGEGSDSGLRWPAVAAYAASLVAAFFAAVGALGARIMVSALL